MTDTTLSPERYLEQIDADTDRLLAMGELGLDAAVPSCPGWTVADLVEHVAMVYAHKVRVLADGEFPKDWPPSELQDREPIEFLRESRRRLFDEFGRHSLDEETATFGTDETVGFWYRRMALEIAVHRYDGELAHGQPGPVAADVALDGIDEMLRVMLGGPWWDGDEWQSEHPVDAVVAIEAGGVRWRCDVRQRAVDIRVGDGDAAATIVGDPEDVFLWVWGRAGDDAVSVRGDETKAAALRLRIAEVSD